MTLDIYLHRIEKLASVEDLINVKGNIKNLLKYEELRPYSIDVITSVRKIDELAMKNFDGKRFDVYPSKWFGWEDAHVVLTGNVEFSDCGKPIHGAGFGVTKGNHTFLMKYDPLAVRHEVGHLLGISYPDNFGGNCETPDCLMKYSPKSDSFCFECADILKQKLKNYKK